MAEDGPLDAKYPLIETPAPSPSQRTEWNVRDSEATLIIVWGSPQGGTLKTAAAAARLKKPFLLINMLEKPAVEAVQKWIEKTQAHVVNIAGPRASEVPEAYEEAKLFLTEVFASEDDDDDETGLLPE